MSLLELVIIGIGGFIGAVIRYFLSRKMNDSGNMPIGTLVVNLAGAFLIGLVFGLELTRVWTMFYISGLAGALTTFSTMNKEIIQLWYVSKKNAVYYLVATYFFGLSLTSIGFIITSTR